MNRSMAALVIGNAEYEDGNKLANPAHDATDLGAKLQSYGFKVVVATDCTNKEMDNKLKEFRKLLDTHEVGLFFFAGHGMQIDGSNYLIATDTDMETETDAKHSSMSLDKVVDVMSKSNATTKIVVLDACRNDPWRRAWQRSHSMRGLASVYAPKGTIIGFATSPGEVASDGVGRNGTYTSALLQHIDAPDCSIEMMFKRVRNTVAAASAGKQTTWEHTSLSGEFYFNLSLGNLIDEYSGTALADSLFVLDEAKKSHQIIAGLKVRNWYTQNPALAKLTADAANQIRRDSLFVIGRNIYQAACGSAAGAGNFISDFMQSTRSYKRDKRKALLDGMLFEIFFDSKGNRRDHIKKDYFSKVFELQQYAELKSSFDFIAEVLAATGGNNFYALPGKGHNVSVTVSTKETAKRRYVDAVYIDGKNVLRSDDDADDTIDEKTRCMERTRAEFSDFLAEELVVPLRNLSIAYTPTLKKNEDDICFPIYWTVRKS